jgi:hypothetical protein
LVVTAIARRRKPKISKTAEKVKGWVKSVAKNPTVKSLIEEAAERVLAESGKGATGRAKVMSARRKRELARSSGS